MQGVFGSGVVFYLQSWCISVRGPLYSAMFTPLCTVLTTALSAAILHEELHMGRHAPLSSLGKTDRVTGLNTLLSIQFFGALIKQLKTFFFCMG